MGRGSDRLDALQRAFDIEGIGVRDRCDHRLEQIRARSQHLVELGVSDSNFAGRRHPMRRRDQHIRERPQALAHVRRHFDASGGGHAGTFCRLRVRTRWSAVRSANAAIVLVGLHPPDVTNTLPSAMYRLGTSWARPKPSTTES